jgi:hypothetical protein
MFQVILCCCTLWILPSQSRVSSTSPKIPCLRLLLKATDAASQSHRFLASSRITAATRSIRTFSTTGIIKMAAPAVAANAETLDLKKVRIHMSEKLPG